MAPQNVRLGFALVIGLAMTPLSARTVYRCVADGTVSLATAPEPGSRCEPHEIDDQAALLPTLWGSLGVRTNAIARPP